MKTISIFFILFTFALPLTAQRLLWQPVNGQEVTIPSVSYVNNLINIGERILVATTNKGIFRSPDEGRTWQESNQGLSTTDTRTITKVGNIVLCGVNGSLLTQGIFASVDSARTWKRVSTFGAYLFLYALGTKVYGNGGSSPFESLDTGKTWKPLMVDTLGFSYHFSLDNNSLYTTTYTRPPAYPSTLFYQSADTGKKWVYLGHNYGEFEDIKRIDSILFITIREFDASPGKFLRLNTKTQIWRDLYPIDFDGVGRRISTIHTIGKRILYADNGNGVYSSDDLGETWQSDKDGLPNSFAIFKLLTISNNIYAVGTTLPTRGGIVYRASLSPLTSVNDERLTPQLTEPCFLEQNYPNPANMITTLRWRVPKETEVSITVYDTYRRPILKPVTSFQTSAGIHETLLDVHSLPSGTYTVMLRTEQHICTKLITIIH